VSAASCERPLVPAQSSADLHLNLRRADQVTLQWGESLSELMEAGKQASFRLQTARTASTFSERIEPVTLGARIVVATPADAAARSLAEALAVEFPDEGFRYLGSEYARPADVLVATFADPAQPALPLTLVLANGPNALSRLLAQLETGWRPNARVYRAGEVVLDAALSVRGRASSNGIVHYAPRWQRLGGRYDARGAAAAGLSVLAAREVDDERVRTYCQRVLEVRERLSAWAPVADTVEFVLILDSHVDPEALAPTQTLARFSPEARNVQALLARGLPDDGGQAVARGLLLEALGAPAAEWLLDAAAVDAARTWWGRPLSEWCAWLISLSEHKVLLENVLAADALTGDSPHRVLPLRALVLQFLRANTQYGQAYIDRVWSGAEEFAVTSEMQRAFEVYIQDLIKDSMGRVMSRRKSHYEDVLASQGMKGVVLSAPVGRGSSGLGTRRAEASIEQVRRAGANSVQVVSYMVAAPGPGTGRALGPPARLGSFEGDVALAISLAGARREGMQTFLQPQLLTSPSGTYVGGVVRTTEPEWTEFFEQYARFIRHYALLAELVECDVLSIGAGYPSTTRVDDEHGEQKRAGWAYMIRLARQSFSGALTFAAAHQKQAREIEFWDALDFVGVDLFPFLGKLDKLSAADDDLTIRKIEGAIAQIRLLADAKDKPFLVTEVAFRSTARAWNGAYGNGGRVDLQQQERLIWMFQRALLRAKRRDLDVPYYFFGRWSTDPEAGGSSDRSYVVQRKPAENALRRLFRGR